MGLLDGGIAQIFNSVFSSIYLDATLHAGTGQPIYADGGRIVGYIGGGDQSVKAQIDAATEAMRQAEGFAQGDVRLIILTTYGRPVQLVDVPHSDDATLSDGSEYAQASYGNVVQMTSDHEVTVQGVRYSIQSVERDPAFSHWVCRGRARPGVNGAG